MKFYFFLINTICKNSYNLISEERLYFNENINLYNCYFNRLNEFQNGNGGILLIENFDTKLNINECIFYKCNSNGDGGCIYYSSQTINSGINLTKTCSNECQCGKNLIGNFCLLLIKKDINNINNIILLSILKCGYNYNGYYSIRLQNGNQKIKFLNSTNNKCEYISSIGIIVPNDFFLIYSNINNNKVLNDRCLYFYSGLNNNINFTNIINNNSPNLGIISIYNNGNNNFNYCIFNNNLNNLFFIEIGNINLFNSILNNINELNLLNINYLNNNNFINLNLILKYSFNFYLCNFNNYFNIKIKFNFFLYFISFFNI